MKKKTLAFLFCLFCITEIFAQGVTLSSPSNGSNIGDVKVSLYWGTISGSSYYDYECDTTSNFNSPALKRASRTSNYATITNLYFATTYYWRVRARTSSDTTVWSAVWTFHTRSDQFTLSSPASGSTIPGITASLYWTSIDGCDNYDYECDITPNFNSSEVKRGTRSSNYATVSNLRYATTYYWHARARNSVDTTQWSAVWTFNTSNAQISPSSPANGSAIQAVTTTLYWTTIEGSSNYDYECDVVPTFDSPALKSGTKTNNYTTVSNLYYDTMYYWRVRARSSVDATPWSAIWTFHTSNGLISLSSPANGSQISGVSTTLYWTTIDGSSNYDYQCDMVPTFDSPALKTGTKTNNYVSISNLSYATTYYWRARARNTVDTTSWSAVWTFNTRDRSFSLSSPSNGAFVNGVTTTLYWQSVEGTTNYDYECDTTPTFNSPALKTGTKTNNYTTVSNLYYGTTYYWRARGRNSADVTDWSDTWTFTTRPDIVALSSPTTGATLSGVSTTLYWNAIEGSTYYDYRCDTTPLFNSPALKSGARSNNYVTVSNLLYGAAYYWQVRARNAVDTTQWSTVWTFGTVLPSLTLSSPASGSDVDGVTTTLYWNSIEGSTYYDYECDVVPTFDSPALKSGSRSSNYVTVTNLYYSTTYYWRVRARNTYDQTAWSAVWTFTTRPDIVTLSSPTTGATLSGVSTTLYWNAIEGSTYYDYRCDTTPTFNSPALKSGARSNNYVTVSNLLYGATYYWQVRARDAVDTTQWSTVWTFGTVLPSLTLSSPTSGSDVDGVTTTLYWSSIDGSTYYDYQCDVVPTFNSPALKSGSRSNNYVTVTNLYYSTTYYWRARARNSYDTTAWSSVWTFTTRPDIVTLSSPVNYTILPTVSTTLYWGSINGSSYYDYEIATSANFGSTVVRSGSVSGNYVSISGLSYGTSYMWRVRARDAVDTTDWCDPWKFTTILQDLTLSSPSDGSFVNGVTTTLYWNGITGSTYYDYRCDTVATFNSPALKTGSRSNNYVTVSNLYYSTTYYWQARARNANDTTDWSTIWTFTTTPDVVTLSSPSTGTTLNAVTASLYWSSIDGTTYYDYQCDVNPTFDSPLLRSGSVSNNYATISNLHYVSTYYWRVRARNAVDTTQWSAVWYFNTTEHCTINNSFTATACDSYTWNNQTYTQSGTYLQQFTSVQACDSIVTLYLTITSSAPTTENRTICAGDLPYDWNGVTFYDAGSQSVALTSVNGCDSIVTMNLTVSDIAPTTESRTICASELPYIWNDVVFASSDTRIVTLVSANGCDSVVTMRLFVNPVDSVTDVLTICAGDLPYVWNGVTFYGAGTQTTTLTAANGCDSVVMMQLDVNSVVNTTEDVSVCASDLPYIWNGLTLNSAGTQTVVLTSVNGCDSVVTLNLTVNPTYNLTEDITIPENELPYVWNGFTFTTGGSQTAQLTSVTGCDSTVTLNLTVTSGIIDFSGREVKCYPNPFGTTLTISGLQIGEWLTMYDATGRVLLRREVSSETEVLNTTALSKGVYFLQTGGQIIKVVRN